jgi:hypothetical protein
MQAGTDHSRRPVRRRLGIGAIVVSLVVPATLFVASPPASAATTSFFMSTRSPVAVGNTPYKMTMFVSKGSTGVFLSLTFTRKATTGGKPQQSHTYSFSLSGPSFTCTTNLSNCLLDTGTQFAAGPAAAPAGGRDYGRIDMDYDPSAPGQTQTFRCRNGDVSSRVTTRQGAIDGPFTLRTFNSFFGTLTNIGAGKIPNSIPVTVTKFVNVKNCPPGPTPDPVCFQRVSLGASSFAEDFFSFSAQKVLPSGNPTTFSFFLFESNATTAPASISHQIADTVPTTAFGVNTLATLNSATVNGDAANPFIIGDTTFTRVGAVQQITLFPGCIQRTANGTVAGPLKANWDGIPDTSLGEQSATLQRVIKT